MDDIKTYYNSLNEIFNYYEEQQNVLNKYLPDLQNSVISRIKSREEDSENGLKMAAVNIGFIYEDPFGLSGF